MPKGPASISTRTPVMTVLAVTSLIVAGIAFFAPLPFLKPPAPPSPPPAPPPVAAAVPDSQSVKIEAKPWAPLAISLDAFREKSAEPPAPTTAPVTDASQNQPPPTPSLPPLSWTYKGTIDGPGSRAALVLMPDGKARFVFTGQKLPDQNNPGPGRVTIVEISDSELVVDREGTQERVPIQRSELNDPSRSQASSASPYQR